MDNSMFAKSTFLVNILCYFYLIISVHPKWSCSLVMMIVAFHQCYSSYPLSKPADPEPLPRMGR